MKATQTATSKNPVSQIGNTPLVLSQGNRTSPAYTLQRVKHDLCPGKEDFIKEIEAHIIHAIVGEVTLFNVDVDPNALEFYGTIEEQAMAQFAIKECLTAIMPNVRAYAITQAVRYCQTRAMRNFQ